MREVTSIVDDVHRWHDQGGWSQARYQRGILKETRDHVKHAADELFNRFKRGARAAPDHRNARRAARRDRRRTCTATCATASPAGSTSTSARNPAQVAKEAAAGDRGGRDAQREREWLDRLQSELGRNARGVAGLAETLDALNERRVEAMLLQQGFRAEG